MSVNVTSFIAAISACVKGEHLGSRSGTCGVFTCRMNGRRERVGTCLGGASHVVGMTIAEGGQWVQALALLVCHKMLETGMTPDGMNFSAAWSSCKRGRQWEQTVVLRCFGDARGRYDCKCDQLHCGNLRVREGVYYSRKKGCSHLACCPLRVARRS